MPKTKEQIKEESWHYTRTCENCGYVWGGLHCPHDGYQNPCPKCGTRPVPVPSRSACDCEFDYNEGDKE
jgi:hypothetical protein